MSSGAWGYAWLWTPPFQQFHQCFWRQCAEREKKRLEPKKSNTWHGVDCSGKCSGGVFCLRLLHHVDSRRYLDVANFRTSTLMWRMLKKKLSTLSNLMLNEIQGGNTLLSDRWKADRSTTDYVEMGTEHLNSTSRYFKCCGNALVERLSVWDTFLLV